MEAHLYYMVHFIAFQSNVWSQGSVLDARGAGIRVVGNPRWTGFTRRCFSAVFVVFAEQ